MKLAPIIVFAYNRPHYLQETLTALKNNKEAAESDLFVYCDGPKDNASEKNLALINEVRQLAHSQQWCKNIHIIESTVNKGLSRSIIAGVTDVINKYGKVIVLEDDIVVSRYFLKFMNDGLGKYQHDERVSSISGYNFPVYLENGKETFFSKSVSCWGWATWNRAWKIYDNDGEHLLKQIKNKRKVREFNFNYTYPYINMLKRTIAGKTDSWAIKWYASCFLNDMLTLFPSKSLIKNIGSEGTNFNADNSDFLGQDYTNESINYFEDNVAECDKNRKGWETHFKQFNRRRLTFKNLKYLFSKLKLM